MPKVNLGKKPPDKLRMLLVGYIEATGTTRDDLGRIIGTCDDTARKRVKNPDEMTIGDLKRIGKSLGIPVDELRAAITYN